ncbi:probable RNA polymerase II nuclear localization protein SLC7A6OS [Chironomus tepperi]|uniref:probable RNA polymerase II nuclear localization protein SLC7A6OS n=1 Tax=Chironomus tepperi TaxID=113505 RepID=UPI00391F4560
MAPTIIRVKRKFDETQEIDSRIILNCKKQKLSDKDVVSHFSFVGTVEEENVIPNHMLKISKKDAEVIVQTKSNLNNSGLSNRVSENLEKSKEKRFKVVNFMRNCDKSADQALNEEQIILDVERDYESTNENKTADDLSATNSKSYVYDIYVAQDDFSSVLQADIIDLNDLSILEYNDYLYSCPRLTNEIDDNLHDDYDEDSNDENNWRNDYPDEEDLSDFSVDERAMRRAMQNFGIDNDLSTSDDDDDDEIHETSNDGFVYSINAEDNDFHDDYDYNYTGTSYAKYRKRMLKELQSDYENSSDDD